jgi:hypothetical protein
MFQIDDDTSVKLCGACHPKVAPLPDDKDAILVGDFVYVSPEVLKGELYVSCADIYFYIVYRLHQLFNRRSFL